MPIHHSVWRVAKSPSRLLETTLSNEHLLEDMIVASPEILSDQWMIIGRQEDTGFGGRIDLLAIAPDGTLILIELKRGRTPREVVAQAIDYATWLEGIDAEEVGRIDRGLHLNTTWQATPSALRPTARRSHRQSEPTYRGLP